MAEAETPWGKLEKGGYLPNLASWLGDKSQRAPRGIHVSKEDLDGESPLAPLKAKEKPLETQKQVGLSPLALFSHPEGSTSSPQHCVCHGQGHLLYERREASLRIKNTQTL